MRVRIVHLKKTRSGELGRREESRDVEELSLGRGPENDLQLNGLLIELHHSQLRKLADGVHIKTVGSAELLINDKRTSERRVSPGDVLRIGPFEIRVIEPADGEDLAFELEELERGRSAAEELGRLVEIGADRGPFTQRKLAWGIGVATAVLFLALPLSSGLMESAWDSGPLSRSHAFIANDCRACHAVGFQRVKDDQCLACHAEIGAHAAAASIPARLATLRCASCHMEHNGSMGLAALDQALCADCHRDLSRQLSSTEVSDVSDFGLEHPEFRISVVQEDPSGGRVARRLALDRAVREESGLKFNHETHVGRAGKGEQQNLDCSSCHLPDIAGKNMLPVEFEEHCHGCHPLNFDGQFPREALHGDPVEMRKDLVEFYAGIELRAIKAEQPKHRLDRRLPGRVSEARLASAREAAQGSVQQADAFLMDEQKPGECARCHTVLPEEAEDGGHQLASVLVAEVWMPKGKFRHRSHSPFACRDCHPAAAVYNTENFKDQARPDWSLTDAGPYALFTPEELLEEHGVEPSRSSTDVLIPHLGRCQSCHGGEQASPPKVASACVLCHPFHREEHGQMRSARAIHGPPQGEKQLN